MRKELDEALVRDFPELYADRHGDKRTTAMCWGFECSPGWEPLIRKLLEQLTFLSKVEGVPVKVTQVKEKYGELCFSAIGCTEIMDACISEAERRSTQICEECGDRIFSKTRSIGYWLRTLCPLHAVEQNYPITEWEAKEINVTEYIKEEKNEIKQRSYQA